jgi:hypothetical protein
MTLLKSLNEMSDYTEQLKATLFCICSTQGDWNLVVSVSDLDDTQCKGP